MIRHILVSCLLLGSAHSYTCWNCTCSGTDCGVAPNYCQQVTNSTGTVQLTTVTGPSSIGASQVTLNELCQIEATYQMSAADSNGYSTGELQSLSRGVAWFQAQSSFEMDMSMNRTGTFCSLSGNFLTCTYICYGSDCNDLTDIKSIGESYYGCYACVGSNVGSSTEFQNCLNEPSTWTSGGVNWWNTKTNPNSNMITVNIAPDNVCQTIVSYYASNYTVAAIDRASSYPTGFVFPGANSAYSWAEFESSGTYGTTLGYCYNTTQNIGTSTIDVVNCVKNCLYNNCNNELEADLISPGNASCYQCSAQLGDANFENCLNNINSTSNGQFLALCSNSQEYCASVVVYDSSSGVQSSGPVAIQRMCTAKSNTDYNGQSGCWNMETNGADTGKVLCMEQCDNGASPCNNVIPEFVTPAAPPNSGKMSFASGVLLAVLAGLM